MQVTKKKNLHSGGSKFMFLINLIEFFKCSSDKELYMRIFNLFFFLRFTNFEIIFIFRSEPRISKGVQMASCVIYRVRITSARSSCSQMFFKTGNLKNCTIFTRRVRVLF